MTRKALHLTGDDAADALLSSDPFAVLVGLMLDQQYPMEHAFAGPRKIADRMGGFAIGTIAEADLDQFVTLCVQPPAIHRYGGSMARRVHALANHVLEHYDGDTEQIWRAGDPDAVEVLRRVKALPGYGDQKARIFVALLGKQLGATPDGWREAAGAYGDEGSRRSIADVTSPETLAEVRAFKKAAKAAAKDAEGAAPAAAKAATTKPAAAKPAAARAATKKPAAAKTATKATKATATKTAASTTTATKTAAKTTAKTSKAAAKKPAATPSAAKPAAKTAGKTAGKTAKSR